MTKVTSEEIAIIKRIAAIENITHEVKSRWNPESGHKEDCDCFHKETQRQSFEWCAHYDSFEDFIRDYTRFKYECGYDSACRY
jgi:hypothetical protein